MKKPVQIIRVVKGQIGEEKLQTVNSKGVVERVRSSKRLLRLDKNTN